VGLTVAGLTAFKVFDDDSLRIFKVLAHAKDAEIKRKLLHYTSYFLRIN